MGRLSANSLRKIVKSDATPHVGACGVCRFEHIVADSEYAEHAKDVADLRPCRSVRVRLQVEAQESRVWLGDEGWVFTATILTQTAAPELAWLHERMPVNVAPDLRDAWFDPNIDGDELTAAVAARSNELAQHRAVARGGDGAQLIEGL